LLLSLLFLLNIAAMALLAGHAAAAMSLDAALQSSRCSDPGAATDGIGGSKRSGDCPSCPFCAVACPMCVGTALGTLPEGSTTTVALPSAPRRAGDMQWQVRHVPGRYLSDAASQAPPTPVGNHAQRFPEDA
jgi:hypothetical protein